MYESDRLIEKALLADVEPELLSEKAVEGKKDTPQPAWFRSCVGKLVSDKGKTVQSAFAICTSTFKKAGYFDSEAEDGLSAKGRSEHKKRLSDPETPAKDLKYEKAIKRKGKKPKYKYTGAAKKADPKKLAAGVMNMNDMNSLLANVENELLRRSVTEGSDVLGKVRAVVKAEARGNHFDVDWEDEDDGSLYVDFGSGSGLKGDNWDRILDAIKGFARKNGYRVLEGDGPVVTMTRR